MRLMNGTLRPGIVKKVLENGEIKVVAPGLFSNKDVDNSPPIYPFFGNHANTYSQPKEGDEVWVLNLSDNSRQLYWFRKDDYKTNNKELLIEENVEIICNREFAGGLWATIYFSDGSGWVINRDSSKIQIRPNGSIVLDSGFPGRVIDVNPKSISLGAIDKAEHPAAFGDKATKAFEIIQSTLEAIQNASKSNQHTKAIGVAISPLITQLKDVIPEVSSQNVTLN